MQLRLFFALPLFAAMVLSTPATCAYAQSLSKGTNTAQLPKSQEVRNFSERILDKVVPGHTTKAEVEALLGKPWSDTELGAAIAGDCRPQQKKYPGDPSVTVWEFRGRDSNGSYRVHIEFDEQDITTVIAKIPDKTGRATARVNE